MNAGPALRTDISTPDIDRIWLSQTSHTGTVIIADSAGGDEA